MSKRLLFIIIIFNTLIFFTAFFTAAQVATVANESDHTYEVIPDEAIRLRILANSDNEQDQLIKHLVRDEVRDQVTDWVQHISDIDEARQLIQTNIPEIEATARDVLAEHDSDQSIQVAYGDKVIFPTKLYDRFLYPAGEYEAILITLGEGKGANWWCVLFPPLCFLDFSNEATVVDGNDLDDDEEKQVEVKFFLFEWLGWS